VGTDIEVHHEPGRGQVYLRCAPETFTRLRDLLLAEAGVADTGGRLANRMVIVEILASPVAPPPMRRRDKWPLLGCGVVGCAVLFVFATGVATIAGWVR